jgi:hypothetical protein
MKREHFQGTGNPRKEINIIISQTVTAAAHLHGSLKNTQKYLKAKERKSLSPRLPQGRSAEPGAAAKSKTRGCSIKANKEAFCSRCVSHVVLMPRVLYGEPQPMYMDFSTMLYLQKARSPSKTYIPSLVMCG